MAYKLATKAHMSAYQAEYAIKNADRIRARLAAAKDHRDAVRKVWYEANKARLSAEAKAYRDSHPGENAAKCRASYAAHKEARMASSRRWYWNNRERALANKRSYYRGNKARIQQDRRKYRLNYPEKVRAANAKKYSTPEGRAKVKAAAKIRYQCKKKEIHAVQAAWCLRNKDKVRGYAAKHHAANPEKRKVITHRRRAILANAEGSHTTQDLRDLMASQKGRCGYCGTDVTKENHLDHREPLSRGGSNWPSNLQYLCPPCNLQKGVLPHEEFMRRKGYDLI
jgi:5-methylcytosine-specific restriction endonuclease McrA